MISAHPKVVIINIRAGADSYSSRPAIEHRVRRSLPGFLRLLGGTPSAACHGDLLATPKPMAKAGHGEVADEAGSLAQANEAGFP